MSIINSTINNFIDVIPINEEKEIWNETSPKKGDHIRVNRGLYCHHGIYINDEEVIHFSGREEDNVLEWSKVEVINTDLITFLKGDVLEVKEYTEEELKDLYPVEHIVTYARACLGDAGYNLAFNNCEHFANVCTLGRFRSGQVEKVFDLILGKKSIVKRRKDMGIFSFIGKLFGGNKGGGSRSVSNTNYEPDKVRVAEIENDAKLRLGRMELEKVKLIKNAKLELLEKEYYCQMAIEEAKAKGFNYVAQSIVALQSKLDEITEKRLEIIEKSSLNIIKDIEGFYRELGEKINKDNEEYNTSKLPILLNTLNQFEKGSDAYELYQKRIQDDMTMHAQSITRQFENLSKRQDQIINGFLKSKDKIMEQSSQITAGLLEKATANYSGGFGLQGSKDMGIHENLLDEKNEDMILLEGES